MTFTNTKIMRRPNTELWKNRLEMVQNKFPQIIYLEGDKNHKPYSKRGVVIWRCLDHEYVKPPVLKNKEPYYSQEYDCFAYKITNPLMFYETKMEANACCHVGANIAKKIEGYEICQNLLNNRAPRYNTEWTIIDPSPEEWTGKRQQRQNKDLRITIYCKRHNLKSSIMTERLIYHTHMACPKCRKDMSNWGKGDDRVRERYLRHTGDQYKIFRLDVNAIWGKTCALTQCNIGDTYGLLDAHHINQKEIYSGLKMNAKENGIMLLNTVHMYYHKVFLSSVFDTSYDPVTAAHKFIPEANIYTFILFLEHLKRDFLIEDENVNTVLQDLNFRIRQGWKLARKKDNKLTVYPEISISKIERLLKILYEGPYIEAFHSQPESSYFLDSFKKSE